MHVVVETPRFEDDAEHLVTTEEREAVVDLVASNPLCGAVVPAGGRHSQGSRRLWRSREARRRKGDLFGGGDLPVFLLAAFAKNEKSDLTPAERAAIGNAAKAMIVNYRRRR